jgi:choline dehydrogenase-like flavoprotein
MANNHVQAVVIGAGAGGGVVAKELSTAGISVVLLERGGWISFADHGDDELTAQRIFPLKPFLGPDMKRYRRVAVDQNGNERIVLPNEWAYGNVAACVGSGTVAYGAMGWRFMQEDFKMKSTYGEIPGSTLEDWPISYDDLEPYYEKVEWEVGVSGDDTPNPFAPPRRKDYPMPAFGHNREARILEDAAKRLGLHPFSIPMLRNSVPYNGRADCIHVRNCVGFACRVNAKNGTHNTVIPTALESGNCALRTHCKVARIVSNDRGRITGVEYFDENDNKQTQTADIVILAASATETPRLLLNSATRHYPRGIGNRHDWVGRNLQDHAYAGANGLFEEEIYDDVGPGASVAICDFAHHNPGCVGGAMLSNGFITMPYAFSRTRPPGAPRWGSEHKTYQREQYKRYASISGPVQEIPVFDSRIQVTDEVKDHWGIPVAKLSGYRHEEDLKTAAFIAEKAEQWLQEAGAVKTWKQLPGSGLGAAQHQAGSCRMGDDPQTSVTNSYGQVHGIDNLFIADGSLHVTNGAFNPALTIMALAYRVGGHIVQRYAAKS